MLYIVPTPIGNLKDITLRALEILRSVELILAEDTRTSGVLLRHYEISKPLRSFHQHNEHQVLHDLIRQLKSGTDMALISDAGTPGISDPAFLLVRECIRENIEVQTLPGATALIPALVNSGLPNHRFSFEGFIPLKKGRHTLLQKLAEEERTMIFYESPVRLNRTLKDFSEYFGEDRQACVCRELTKKFEESIRGSLKFIAGHFINKPAKGEIVIVVAGKDTNHSL